MKVRIKVPTALSVDKETKQWFVDEVLLWAMEVDMNVTFYSFYWPSRDDQWKVTTSLSRKVNWTLENTWAVFTVEKDNIFMFTLRWGALVHKQQRESTFN